MMMKTMAMDWSIENTEWCSGLNPDLAFWTLILIEELDFKTYCDQFK